MIELFGELYYIDFDEVEDFLILDKETPKKVITEDVIEVWDENNNLQTRTVERREHIKHKEIDGVRFELIRNFINDISDEGDETDPSMGIHNLKKTSIRFKLAFNTLLAYGILKKID